MKVAIVGQGPRGIQALFALAEQVRQQPGDAGSSGCLARKVSVVCLDPNPVGWGAAYSTDQPDTLRLNVSPQIVDLPGCPTFTEWLSSRQEPTFDVPRQRVGLYLAEMEAKLMASLPAGMHVEVRRASVQSVDLLPGAQQLRIGFAEAGPSFTWGNGGQSAAPVEGDPCLSRSVDVGLLDGTPVDRGVRADVLWEDFDEVLLAIGHAPAAPSSIPSGYSLHVVNSVYPVGEQLSEQQIPPGSRVVVKGAALTFIDAALVLHSRPADRRPSRVIPTSRRGLLMNTKPLPRLPADVEGVLLTEARAQCSEDVSDVLRAARSLAKGLLGAVLCETAQQSAAREVRALKDSLPTMASEISRIPVSEGSSFAATSSVRVDQHPQGPQDDGTREATTDSSQSFVVEGSPAATIDALLDGPPSCMSAYDRLSASVERAVEATTRLEKTAAQGRGASSGDRADNTTRLFGGVTERGRDISFEGGVDNTTRLFGRVNEQGGDVSSEEGAENTTSMLGQVPEQACRPSTPGTWEESPPHPEPTAAHVTRTHQDEQISASQAPSSVEADAEWALGRAWSLLYPEIVARLSWNTTPSPHAWQEFQRQSARYERLTFGPTLPQAQRLLALCDEGFVDTTWLDAQRTLDSIPRHEWSEHADVALNAVLAPPGVLGNDRPLIERLLDQGLVTQASDGRRGLLITPDAQCLTAHNTPSHGLSCVGRVTEDVVIGHDTLNRHAHPHLARWAERIGSRL